MRLPLILLAGLLTLLAPQSVSADELTGTLKTVREQKAITLGVRESSIPFSFLNPGGRPVGYSVDLCQEVVAELGSELGVGPIEIRYKTVTSENRFAMLRSGEIDLECGSTTNNRLRQREVAFSPVMFVAGTKLAVKQGSRVTSYRQLAGKSVVVTAGTTNEAAVQALSDKQGLGITIVRAPDHAAAFAMLQADQVEAIAGDDVLLYGLIAQTRGKGQYKVVGEYLSYDPYGLVFRRDDPDFGAVVDRTFRKLAESRELVRLYDSWFQKRLPGGETLDLPMSPQLEELFHIIGLPDS
jgi:glutamate/aspartate transport system substrate-binding protein